MKQIPRLVSLAVMLVSGCETTLHEDDPSALLIAQCDNGGVVLDTCTGSCTYTPNGNSPARTTYSQSSCQAGVIVCTFGCSWVYNSATWSNAKCTKGTPEGFCPQYGPITGGWDSELNSTSFPWANVFSKKSCDSATTTQAEMNTYCTTTYGGGNGGGVPTNGAADIACAAKEAQFGNVTKQQDGLCCGPPPMGSGSGGGGTGSGRTTM